MPDASPEIPAKGPVPVSIGAPEPATATSMQSPGTPMPKMMQIALGAYVIAMFAAILYLMIKVWPISTPGLDAVYFPWGRFELPPEVRLMLIAVLAGALGAYVHLATSFADYSGNQRLMLSWAWWYVLRPFIGMALAEVVYLSLRGGLLSATGDNVAGAISPYGVAAVTALTGLFSRQATDKLQETFETLFRTQQKVERKDALPTTGSSSAGAAASAAKSSAATAGKES
jgi:hypothetical protein